VFPVEVLNVLGAGDAFASGLIYAYLRGWPLENAVRVGNATDAIIVTRHGCANIMPTLEELQAFMAEEQLPA
jgi:5-dehydro-2-deoxygluconokinase